MSIFTKLAEVVSKAGKVISNIGENYPDNPEISQTGEKVKILSIPKKVFNLFSWLDSAVHQLV